MDKAFEILSRQYRPMVLSYLRALVRDPHLAEDLTQETFLAAQRALPSFDEDREFGAWVRGIARNKVLESRRAAARHPLVVDSRVVEGMEDVYSAFDGPGDPWDERLEQVHRCLAKLSEKLRQSVEQVYQKRRSLEQAAAALGTSFAAIARRLSRARTLIRECVTTARNQEVQGV